MEWLRCLGVIGRVGWMGIITERGDADGWEAWRGISTLGAFGLGKGCWAAPKLERM